MTANGARGEGAERSVLVLHAESGCDFGTQRRTYPTVL